MSTGDVPKKNNQALRFIEGFTPTNERGAIKTAGTSAQLISEDEIYLRKKSARKLLLVQVASGPTAAPGDGTYAELWLSVW